MNITREADYALRVIALLSRVDPKKITSASTISDQENIPSQFLLKILKKLRKASLIKSHMGVNGGYQLNKDPHEISLKNVIETIDGPIYLNPCLYNPEECNKNFTSACPLHHHLGIIENNLLEELDSVSFEKITNTTIKNKNEVY